MTAATAKIDASKFPTDRLTFVCFGDDGSYSVYLGPQWLANEDTKEEAEKEARHIIAAYDNGAAWAKSEFPNMPAA